MKLTWNRFRAVCTQCWLLGRWYRLDRCVCLGVKRKLWSPEIMRAYRNLPKAIEHRQRKKKALPAQHARARSAPNPAAATLADVKPYLRTLLGAPEVSDPASREAEANIRRIADVCGLYLTASSIHSHVESLSSTNDDEKKNRRPRGFELAGELYFLVWSNYSA